nr:aldose 1-epimerase family protein [uncultured Mediterraneibacter sp.]
MKMENGRLCVEISELGAEVTRVFDKIKQTDVLWEADPTYWKRHSPVLFPNVGKTYRNTVLIGGVQYPTSQHGFARDSRFKCICEKKNMVSFLLVSSEETKEVYPFDFELIITYRLDDNVLSVEWEVRNPGEEELYFTIGGHPAFRFAQPGEKKTDYMLKFPGKESLEYILIDPDEAAADPEKIHKLTLKNECCPLTEELFANDALIFDHGQIEEVLICHRDGTPYVKMECEGFPNFGIWSVKDAPFVCLEPWMGRCDDIGYTGELSEKPNVNKVAPGESFKKGYRVIV